MSDTITVTKEQLAEMAAQIATEMVHEQAGEIPVKPPQESYTLLGSAMLGVTAFRARLAIEETLETAKAGPETVANLAGQGWAALCGFADDLSSAFWKGYETRR